MNLEQIQKLDFEALKKNPRNHVEVLCHFREIVIERILGEEDPESRAEFEFLLDRTDQKIREVQSRII